MTQLYTQYSMIAWFTLMVWVWFLLHFKYNIAVHMVELLTPTNQGRVHSHSNTTGHIIYSLRFRRFSSLVTLPDSQQRKSDDENIDRQTDRQDDTNKQKNAELSLKICLLILQNFF